MPSSANANYAALNAADADADADAADDDDEASGASADDLIWRDAPNAWHQQLARIVDHRFKSFDRLRAFALDACVPSRSHTSSWRRVDPCRPLEVSFERPCSPPS